MDAEPIDVKYVVKCGQRDYRGVDGDIQIKEKVSNLLIVKDADIFNKEKK